MLNRFEALRPAVDAGAGQGVDIDEAKEEVRDAAVTQDNNRTTMSRGRPLDTRLHEALLELHRRNGLFARSRDNGASIETIKGIAWLAEMIIIALESGQSKLLLPPV